MYKKSKGLCQALSSNLAEQGFSRLTEVQARVLEACTPPRDMLVLAPTGTGKTIAYGLAVAAALRPVDPDPSVVPFGIVVLPTRELASQVSGVLDRLYAGTGLAAVPLAAPPRTAEAMADAAAEGGVAVFVATPGRLKEWLAEADLDLAGCRCLVFDEADELFCGDYDGDLAPLLDRAPPGDRRIHLYSATRTPALDTAVGRLLDDPVTVDLTPDSAHLPNVEIEAIACGPGERDRLIGTLLRLNHPGRAIVFANRREEAVRLAAKLHRRGFSVVNLTGALRGPQREMAMARFSEGQVRICVATDLAARGIDIDGLHFVVHMGVPENAQVLLHRSGRVGRGAAPGRAVLVVSPEEKARADRLARDIGHRIRWITRPTPRDIREADRSRILVDPVFADGAGGEDETLARILSASFPPDVLSVACARLWRQAQPMARDLDRFPDFQDNGSEWLAIETGPLSRTQMSEILRLICASAGIDKRSIGRIHAAEGHARFEVSTELAREILARGRPGAGPAIWKPAPES